MDINNTSLLVELKKTTYMMQPPSFKDESKLDHVCYLQKPIYRLK